MNHKDVNEQQKEGAGFNFDYGPLLDELIAKLPLNPIVVELGTYLGCSAIYMAEVLSKSGDPFTLYTVDTFEKYGKHQKFFPLAMNNFKACGVRDKVRVLSCRSWEAAGFFDDKEVDLVWVDASHEFVGAKADIDAWNAKVKPGGFLAGHDYSESGVQLAVDRFCFAASKTPVIWNPDGWKSWWIQM